MVLHEFLKYSPLELLIAAAALMALFEWGYIIFARKAGLGAPVSERSSHSAFTPTGGGIIWVITSLAAILFFGNLHTETTWIFFGGIVALGAISMTDDIHPLKPIPRLIAQIVIIAVSFKGLCAPTSFDIYLIIMFCSVGIINAINFLDGICGMLSLYGLVTSCAILYAIYSLNTPSLDIYIPIFILIITAQSVFAIFNLKDIVFAGDTGAITLGYIQVCMTINLILATGDGAMMVFFAVCVFDTGLTTIQRLFGGEQILQPHRKNIYQILTNERKLPQIFVSLTYALLQLLIDALFFLIPEAQHWTYFLVVCTLLTIAYFAIRFSKPSALK